MLHGAALLLLCHLLCHTDKLPLSETCGQLEDIEQIDDILNGPTEGWSGELGMGEGIKEARLCSTL